MRNKKQIAALGLTDVDPPSYTAEQAWDRFVKGVRDVVRENAGSAITLEYDSYEYAWQLQVESWEHLQTHGVDGGITLRSHKRVPYEHPCSPEAIEALVAEATQLVLAHQARATTVRRAMSEVA